MCDFTTHRHRVLSTDARRSQVLTHLLQAQDLQKPSFVKTKQEPTSAPVVEPVIDLAHLQARHQVETVLHVLLWVGARAVDAFQVAPHLQGWEQTHQKGNHSSHDPQSSRQAALTYANQLGAETAMCMFVRRSRRSDSRRMEASVSSCCPSP